MNKILKYLLIVLGIIILVLLLIFGNSTPQYEEPTPEEMVRITEMRHQAYDYALKCGGETNGAVPFDKLDWVLLPGTELKYNATDGTAHLKGYYSPNDSVIYMPYTERETFWIAAHESLHALGWRGHPNKPFKYPCMLTAEQNP